MEREKIKKFQKIVWAYYKKNKRDLPWRPTSLKLRRGKLKTKPNSYHILVSEVMLQQTQVSRVVGKFKEFIKRFPTVSALASAPASEVIRAWQGLGYNRRALYLHRAAQIIVREYKGKVPRDPEFLEKLPGIGHYTARAISVFAYNDPLVFIETNIRSVFIHHFFLERTQVRDNELLPLIEATLADARLLRQGYGGPREYYQALMDYGSYIKTITPNPSRKSAHHVRQKKFKGSERELRGALLRVLAQGKVYTLTTFTRELSFPKIRITKNLEALKKEGLVLQRRDAYSLPT